MAPKVQPATAEQKRQWHGLFEKHKDDRTLFRIVDEQGWSWNVIEHPTPGDRLQLCFVTICPSCTQESGGSLAQAQSNHWQHGIDGIKCACACFVEVPSAIVAMGEIEERKYKRPGDDYPCNH